MFKQMNIICLGGASASAAIEDDNHSSPWRLVPNDAFHAKETQDSLLILCHHPSSQHSVVIHKGITEEASVQPLTRATRNLIQQIGRQLFANDAERPRWLPAQSSNSIPYSVPDLQELYKDAITSSVEVIVFISPTPDCSDFVRALRLLASPELLSVATLEQGIRSIGKLEPPEDWTRTFEDIFKVYYKDLAEQIAQDFNKDGRMIGISPTENAAKVKIVSTILGLEGVNIRKKKIPSGEANQPRSHVEGARGALKRALGALVACLKDDDDIECRAVVVAIENFTDDINPILEQRGIVPDFPVIGDFACNIYFDTALADPAFKITKGTPGPRAADDLAMLLGPEFAMGQILEAVFPGVDSRNWHKCIYPNQDRYDDVVEGCLSDEGFARLGM